MFDAICRTRAQLEAVYLPIVKLVACAALVHVLAGCATPSDPGAMAARDVPVTTRSSERVSIDVLGGRATTAMGASQISDEDFREALKQSILKSGLFREVVDGKAGAYQLSAFIGNLSQPMFGASFTVDMEVEYRLTETSTGRSLWQRSIKTSHTATMGDAAAGVVRLRRANEGAARKNIEMAIGEMGSLLCDRTEGHKDSRCEAW